MAIVSCFSVEKQLLSNKTVGYVLAPSYKIFQREAKKLRKVGAEKIYYELKDRPGVAFNHLIKNAQAGNYSSIIINSLDKLYNNGFFGSSNIILSIFPQKKAFKLYHLIKDNGTTQLVSLSEEDMWNKLNELSNKNKNNLNRLRKQ